MSSYLIQVLGTGCAKCAKLKENADQAVAESGVDAMVEKVEDIGQITSFGVMMTPALVINGEVKCSGKRPPKKQLEALITGAKC